MFVVWYLVVSSFFLCEAGVSAVRWPEGIYGLPRTETGCPEEWDKNGWDKDGWIYQQTVSTNRPQNSKSDDLHMAGYVRQKQIKLYFCTSKSTGSPNRATWPEGKYCIYSMKRIQSMIGGKIALFDYNSKIYASTTCHDSFFNEYTNYKYLYFKCQTSGNKKIPISLPITKPFYLLPYGSRDCQQVKWMVATSEWIKDYTYSYHYKDDTIPYLEYDSQRNELTMYYCYYKSCNYTLNETGGIFQSPGFPGKYPDRQLCSWRIMVHDNHTLHVHFTNFSLYEYDKDCLQLYENNSRIFEPKQAFFGHQRPFTITATSDLMFVFRSDEENNSNGFRAEYTIFKTPGKTTTAEPPTTINPTTTTQPTSKLITTILPITKQPLTTTLPTTNHPIITEATFPLTTNINLTTNETAHCNPNQTKNTYNKHATHPLQKKTCFCDEAWKIVVMVIPLVVLIVLVIIDIICRCRYKKALKAGASAASADDGMVVNPTYGRGDVMLDQPGRITDTSTVNTGDSPPQSRDEPPEYEDVDYTQLNDIPPPRRSSKSQECHALEPIKTDSSAVFYYMLEPPESDGPQCHATEPDSNGASEVFYHTLEPPKDLKRPSYQDLSEVNHHTLNPVYESAENSAPLVEANELYNYIA